MKTEIKQTKKTKFAINNEKKENQESKKNQKMQIIQKMNNLIQIPILLRQ